MKDKLREFMANKGIGINFRDEYHGSVYCTTWFGPGEREESGRPIKPNITKEEVCATFELDATTTVFDLCFRHGGWRLHLEFYE